MKDAIKTVPPPKKINLDATSCDDVFDYYQFCWVFGVNFFWPQKDPTNQRSSNGSRLPLITGMVGWSSMSSAGSKNSQFSTLIFRNSTFDSLTS